MPTVRNAQGADLYAAPIDDEEMVIPIQSKALSKRAAVPLGTDLERLRSRWWIITLGANSDDPICFILTLDFSNSVYIYFMLNLFTSFFGYAIILTILLNKSLIF